VEQQRIKVGDVVQLKSGGPTMVVEDIRDGERFYLCCCVWYDRSAMLGMSQKPHREIFPWVALKSVEAPK
jgi:uncharacterized protein YodC (DUF2158 family)